MSAPQSVSIKLCNCAKNVKVGHASYTTTVEAPTYLEANDDTKLDEFQIDVPQAFENFPLIMQILSKFSHDIKGHQRRILLYTEMMSQEDTKSDKEQYEKYAAVVMRNAEDSTKLMNRYTDFVRILNKPGVVEQLNMGEILDEIMDVLESDIESKQVEMVTKEMAPFVVGSVQEVRILLYQLIENAVVHSTDEPSKVFIEGTILKNGFEFIIEDTGGGLPQADFISGFEHGKILNAKRDSLGIGFTMIQLALKHLEADLWISSEEGKGTRMRVFLPLRSIGNIGGQQ